MVEKINNKMKRKPHPPSQKEKFFSLGAFGTHATGLKCFYPRFRGRFLNQGLNDSIKKELNELP
ncbi:hypothetical protein CGC32_02960 [Helicobacter pylori]|nr:hypothetical protein CGC32_02960 [Helicobacter pylori]